MAIFTGKRFSEYMAECRECYLERCRQENERDFNTEDEIKLSKSYYPDVKYKKYGYYQYDGHTGCYTWSKRKPNLD